MFVDEKRDIRLGYLIHDVSRLRRLLFDRELAPLGITRSQWWVLAFVARHDGLPQTQLAHELDLGKVSLGAIIDRLEASGFVARLPDSDDRRLKRIFLTEKARALLDDIIPVSQLFNERILAGIPREDLEQAARTLSRMKVNLIAAGGQESDHDLDLLIENVA
ncbi:MarR family transcriptional regulator [Oleomonas cavernae]|uniref:MarR family transcriptional regulator n=1 Tax=Oleomonas cavernae TaxID=2320859 RepID=A0A418W8J8_9PROT|nr:MarR family transcriptional regulator [Oleomonas cavernae]RJF86316.1 MarR family transcriptional regulator [Oleomonas cavernae]